MMKKTRIKDDLIGDSYPLLGKRLSVVATQKEAARVILDTADQLIGWDAAYITTYAREQDHLYSIIHMDTMEGEHREVAPPACGPPPTPMARMALEKGPQLISQRNSKQDYELVSFGNGSRNSQSIMLCPIMRKGDAIGVLSIQSYTPGKYNRESLKLLELLADHTSGALERILAEEKLMQSEEQLRLLTKQIPAILWTTNRELRITRLLGVGLSKIALDPEQTLGKTLFDFFNANDPFFVPITMHTRALMGKSATYEMELAGKVFQSHVKPLRDAGEKIIGCINVAHDITDRIRAEQALKQAHDDLENRIEERTRELSHANILLKQEIEERIRTEDKLASSLSLLRATLESTTDGIVVVNNRGEIVDWNRRFQKMWHIPESTLENRRYDKIRDVILRQLKGDIGYMEKIEEITSNPESESFNVLELADGKIFECYSKPQKVKGRSVGRVWSFRDVTRRRRAEKNLERSEEIYREAIENAAGVPYRLIFEQGKYDFVGEGIKSLLGVPSEDFKPAFLRNYILETHVLDPGAPSSQQECAKAFKTGRLDQYRVDLLIKTTDGQEKWVNDCSVPIRDEKTGKVVGALGILQDVTIRKKMEAQARRQQEKLIQTDKMVALGTLVSGVAHEVNNPNNFIMLNTPILRQAWENVLPILEEYYQKHGDFLAGGIYYSKMRTHLPEICSCIEAGALRIKGIVQELRSFARESPGQILESVNLNDVVRSSLTLIDNMLKKSTNRFSVHLDKNLPPVRGNFQRLEQVVINLLQNSCQSLTDRENCIMVSTGVRQKERKVFVEVTDEGTGIPEEIQKYIMDPFFTTKRETGGVGLGLSISSRIVNEHHGSLVFNSKPGKGTTAVMELPMDSHEDSSDRGTQ